MDVQFDTYDNVDSAYYDMCKWLLAAPQVGNTREILNAKIQINDVSNAIISIRNISVEYLFGELLWYFRASNRLAFISKFSSFWNHLSDDGRTCNSAYGYIIFEKYGFDQLRKVIDLLRKDPTSRRAVININVPNENVIETKDEPCTVSIQFLLRDNKLNCTVYMRSNDIWFGFPYDIVFFTELQRIVAMNVEAELGTYTHLVGSLHMYDRDEEKIREIVINPVSNPISFNPTKFHMCTPKLIEAIRKIDGDPKQILLEKLREFDIIKEGNDGSKKM